MKIFLLLLCALSFSESQAQPGGGGGRGGRTMGGGQGQDQSERQRPKMVEFNASNIVGTFNYDDNEAVDKIKLKSKKEAALILDVRQAIMTYNQAVNEIALNNKDNFDTLNVYMNALMKSSRPQRGQQRGSGDYGMQEDNQDNPMRQAKRLAEEKMEPAKKGIQEEEEKLNTKLEGILNEKQFKKWLKYQIAVKKDLEPQAESENNNNRSLGGGQGGSSRGGGRMGY
ncbi:hypothetical protein FPF71_07210 [Algibacter amylolyticus]|uniref:DUF4168 domain-containing protein n=1 Tax=Algibacter amylolyticus TaxID=1608400 RepID=A0A5M7BE63_9FLAO|nr:hypothetical protein [Algibacter amylolyticus]KAA5825691.1 hypothetical protein F2B50_07210 [Algibacter amylolyticus]MBB5268076.1 hypothetical protein [Algibacter amylolyticus]TSJ79989.1 hypothetical protein FPF71_07210 [Algibacter amylolyticus]